MLEAIRVRALRSLPDVVFRARPTLRVLAVGDDRPAFPPESESLAQDDLGAEHWKEYIDALNELRQLAAQGAPARQTRWWRVDGMGEERGLVEIWSAKGELAREVIERPHFDLDRDLHCEYPFAVVEHGWTSDELCGINRAISPISSLLRLLIMPVGCSSITILQSVQREAPGHICVAVDPNRKLGGVANGSPSICFETRSTGAPEGQSLHLALGELFKSCRGI